MSETTLQQHLRDRTIPHKIIRDSMHLDRTLIRKWAIGENYPQRQNAVRLIEVFGEHGIEIDYNDIYQIRKAS